jgi:hypothetical protein
MRSISVEETVGVQISKKAPLCVRLSIMNSYYKYLPIGAYRSQGTILSTSKLQSLRPPSVWLHYIFFLLVNYSVE